MKLKHPGVESFISETLNPAKEGIILAHRIMKLVLVKKRLCEYM
jgi:hypothetical protein